MKIAFCFLISYEHGTLNKEDIWRKWLEPNKDIINVYFHYKNYEKLNSKWIKDNVIPKQYIVDTDYLHVVPAYMSLLNYAMYNDAANQWFCMVTDSCVPIISPLKFREMFLENYQYSIISCKKAWWNVSYVHRANLRLLSSEFQLANGPWFVIKKEDSLRCLQYATVNKKIYNTICQGNVANESIFAIILHTFKQLDKVINASTHATDWTHTASPTSPHLFKEGTKKEVAFINYELANNKYTIFLRKVAPEFPDAILNEYIYREDSNTLVVMKRNQNISRLQQRIFLRWLFRCVVNNWAIGLFVCVLFALRTVIY